MASVLGCNKNGEYSNMEIDSKWNVIKIWKSRINKDILESDGFL